MEMISIISTIIWFVGFIYYTEKIVRDKEGIVEIYDGLIQEHPEILIYISTKYIISLIYFVAVCMSMLWPIASLYKLFNKIV